MVGKSQKDDHGKAPRESFGPDLRGARTFVGSQGYCIQKKELNRKRRGEKSKGGLGRETAGSGGDRRPYTITRPRVGGVVIKKNNRTGSQGLAGN